VGELKSKEVVEFSLLSQGEEDGEEEEFGEIERCNFTATLGDFFSLSFSKI
jgi:hypothetical protein